MLRGVYIAVVVASILVNPTAVSAAGTNEPPIPSAGLDQTVDQRKVVYLDAGGSVDPDGNITDYEWTITTPNGTTTSPDCRDCEQTWFRATQAGTYEVTVAVTDDDGATRTDTLRVTAREVEKPSVTVTGPASTQTGETTTMEADVTAGDAPLQRVTWYRNGSHLAMQEVAGESATVSMSEEFDTAGTVEMRAVVVDEKGLTTRDSHSVQINERKTGQPGDDRWTGTSPSSREINRQNGDGTYRVKLSDGAVRDGNDVIFTSDEVNDLKRNPGVEVTESHEGWNTETRQIVVTNEEVQEDLDRDTGSYRSGFRDVGTDYTQPNSGRYSDPDSDSGDDDGDSSTSINSATDDSVESNDESSNENSQPGYLDEYDSYTEYYQDNFT